MALMTVSVAAQTVTGSGTANTVPQFTGTSTVGNSPISVSSSNVGIGTTTPVANLDVNAPSYGIGASAGLWVYQGSNPNNGGIAMGALSNLVGSIVSLGTDSSLDFQTNNNGAGVDAMRINRYGNVGIGTISPGATLEVNGNVKLTSGSGASITFPDGSIQSTAYTGITCSGGDYAESIDVTGDRTKYDPGDVLVIDPENHGKFLKSAEPYSTAVAGIFSTRPGTVGRRQIGPKNPDEVPMAVVGIVPVKVSAENGAIQPRDLLVSASTAGYAMKGTNRQLMLGAVVGKALGSLESGTGVIEVLVTLQ
jgi:hypothetical protein